MLAKKNRLNLSLPENSVIFIRGKSKFISSKFLLAYFRKNESELRVSFLAPKSVFETAAKRNFYRRLLYSFFEELFLLKKFSLKNELDLVVVLKKSFKESLDNEGLKKDFIGLLDKIQAELKKT